MKLAYVSYEFPPDTITGGIGTYVHEVTRALRQRGHHIEVFCASPYRDSPNELAEDGLIVHRVRSLRREDFRQAIVRHFAARHEQISFDLLESPEYGADGLAIKQQFPQLPLVVKCHTPGFFVKRLNQSLRAGCWKERLRRSLGLGKYKKQFDAEYRIAALAERVISPSASLAAHLTRDWGFAPDAIEVIPNPYVPRRQLLEIPVATNFRVVTFTGRLEVRKGVAALGEAVPRVLKQHPDVVFRFIGKNGRAPHGSGSMVEFLKQELAPHLSQIEFVDHVPLEQVPVHLARTDICVYPSLWENFPYVCLEAMSAARGIVASQEGGMRDMLTDIDGGELIDPTDARQMADKINDLLANPQRRQAMSARARDKVVNYYSTTVVGIIEDFYKSVIVARKKASLPAFASHHDAAA
jgi:glycosyltransferase involved in cell wall biosynthesis